MKKTVSLMLILALVCALFSGCGRAQPEKSPNGAESAETSAGAASSETSGDQPGVVTIVADRELADVLEEMRSAYRIFLGMDYDEVKIIQLPEDVSAREVMLERIRTEIMSGGGPDAFLLCANSVDPLHMKTDDLFPIPMQAAASGKFLPLDKLIESSRVIPRDDLNPVVMEAGKVNGVQYILPILYTYPAIKMEIGQAEYPEELTAMRWQERLQMKDPLLREAFGVLARCHFSSLFPSLVDFSSGKLLVTEEELKQRLTEITEMDKEDGLNLYEKYDRLSFITVWDAERYQSPALASDQEMALLPQINVEGGITAEVSVWTAVNANSERPETAFAMMELLLHPDFVQKLGLTDPAATTNVQPICCQLYHLGVFSKYGLTVNDRWMKKTLFYQSFWDGPSYFDENLPLITSARIPGVMEREITQTVRNSGVENEQDAERLAHELYTTLLMQLAES